MLMSIGPCRPTTSAGSVQFMSLPGPCRPYNKGMFTHSVFESDSKHPQDTHTHTLFICMSRLFSALVFEDFCMVQVSGTIDVSDSIMEALACYIALSLPRSATDSISWLRGQQGEVKGPG